MKQMKWDVVPGVGIRVWKKKMPHLYQSGNNWQTFKEFWDLMIWDNFCCDYINKETSYRQGLYIRFSTAVIKSSFVDDNNKLMESSSNKNEPWLTEQMLSEHLLRRQT